MEKTNFRKEYPSLKKNVNGVDIDLTNEEYEATIAEWEANEIEALALKAEADTKTQIKAQLLTQLGITEEQAKLLLS